MARASRFGSRARPAALGGAQQRLGTRNRVRPERLPITARSWRKRTGHGPELIEWRPGSFGHPRRVRKPRFLESLHTDAGGHPILVMKPAQHRELDNCTCALGLAAKPRSFVVSGSALTDALVWATHVKMRTECSPRSSKMLFAQDKDVVQAFAAHTSEEPLADRATVRRGRREPDDGRSTADGDSIKDATELTVIISNEDPRAVVERHRFAKLLGGRLVRRVSSDVAMNDLAAVETYDEEREDRSESEVMLTKHGVLGEQLLPGPERVGDAAANDLQDELEQPEHAVDSPGRWFRNVPHDRARGLPMAA